MIAFVYFSSGRDRISSLFFLSTSPVAGDLLGTWEMIISGFFSATPLDADLCQVLLVLSVLGVYDIEDACILSIGTAAKYQIACLLCYERIDTLGHLLFDILCYMPGEIVLLARLVQAGHHLHHLIDKGNYIGKSITEESAYAKGHIDTGAAQLL